MDIPASTTVPVSGPATAPAPTSAADRVISQKKLRVLLDRLAQVIITLGGYAVILSILGIFVFLIWETAPLFFSPTGTQAERFTVGALPEGLPQSTLVGVDEQQEVAYVLGAGGPPSDSAGPVTFLSLPSGKPLAPEMPTALAGITVTAVAQAAGKGVHFGLGTDKGRLLPLAIEFTASFDKDVREILPTVVAGAPIQIDPTKGKILRLAYQQTDAGIAVAALTEAGRLWYSTVQTCLLYTSPSPRD